MPMATDVAMAEKHIEKPMPADPGFRLVKSQSVPLTPELAKEFKELAPSPTERKENPSRLKHLTKKLELGYWITTHWVKAKYGDRIYRMNGQHSSNVLCEANGLFPKNAYCHLDEYEVDNAKGLAMLFRQFDDRKSSRSAGDVSNAWQSLFDPISELDTSIAKLGIEAVTWYAKYVEGSGNVKSGDDIYADFAVPAYYDYLQWLGDEEDGVLMGKTKEMRKVGVIAAMHKTFEVNPTEARNFWAQVARGGDYEDSTPSTKLADWLKAASEGSKKEMMLKPGNYYQGSIWCWNAYREDKPIKDVKSDVKKGYYPVVE